MPQPETLTELERAWAENFGCSVEELHAPGIAGITLLANASDYADYHGAYLLRWEAGSAVLTVPADLLPAVAAAICDRSVAEVFDRTYLGQLFGERVDRIIGPAVRHCADASDFRPVDARGTRPLTQHDDSALRRLAAGCGPEGWAESGLQASLDLTRPPTFGCFVDADLAAAGLLVPKGPLRNIDIATHPAHRRRGYGRSVVSAMTVHALAEGVLPHYQALATNTASLALARSLGFVQYATAFAVRLKTG
jgi:GNAT superfamily N-acetyltransferase